MIFRTLVFITALIFATPLNAQFCTYRYQEKAEQYESRICTRVQLSKEEADFIHSWTIKVSKLYSAFLKRQTEAYEQPPDVHRFNIVVMPLKELNSDILPSRPPNMTIDGIYYRGNDILYISYESVLDRSYTLPHEMAHRLNDMIGISDPKIDEQLATQFEEYLANGV